MSVPLNEFVFFPGEGKGILANLDEKGVVTFAIEAGEGCPVRGTEMFNRMMAYFGDRVKAIEGVWRKGCHGGVSTNIDKVNELTGSGMALEDAVHYAWTVTRAKKHGFTRVRVLGQPEGTPGAYVRIGVLIEK